MTTRDNKRAGAALEPQERLCAPCGRPCAPPSLEAISGRLRELVEATPTRRFPEKAMSDGERARELERHAEYYSGVAITLRVGIHLLGQQIDGVCTFCSSTPD